MADMDTDNLTDREFSRSQAAAVLDFSATKIASYNASEGRWLSFFPHLDEKGKVRYYTIPDLLVMAMLIDTMPSDSTGLSQPVDAGFRRIFAAQIREYLPVVLSSGVRDRLVGGTVGRLTTFYLPRWDLLDRDYSKMFDLPR